MDTKYFRLFDGSLEFHHDKILIFDKAKRNQVLLWLTTFTFLTYSITTTIKGYKRHDTGDLWFGLVLTTLWAVISIFRHKEFQKVENEIILSDINQVKFSVDKLDGNIVAKILTKSGLQRKIKIVQEDNQDFAFKNLLVDNKIKID